MIFSKGDRVILENHVRECICSDKEIAVFGLVVPLAEEDGESVSYESLIAVSNAEELRGTIDFKFIGGKVEDITAGNDKIPLVTEEGGIVGYKTP